MRAVVLHHVSCHVSFRHIVDVVVALAEFSLGLMVVWTVIEEYFVLSNGQMDLLQLAEYLLVLAISYLELVIHVKYLR